VTDADGNPVADAYVIGMTNLWVTQTGTDGHYSMPCTAQKLVAASWRLPVMTAGTTPMDMDYGVNTTEYGLPPDTSGPGYVFSGEVSDLSQASPVACDGNPVNFQLPVGATVDITWVTGPLPGDSSETTSPTTSAHPPNLIDKFHLPGLKDQAAPETVAVSPTGQQVIAQLGPGTMQIDGTGTPFTCVGADPAGDGSTWLVTVAAAAVTSVTCTTS
jgi:hypothetical protein